MKTLVIILALFLTILITVKATLVYAFPNTTSILTIGSTKGILTIGSTRNSITTLSTTRIRGDLNRDSRINALDITLLERAIVGLASSGDADINGDGALDCRDITTLEHLIANDM